ncbi:MAG: TetR/AcrR family transcriptional regulator [Actinobacteria bacterium]|nr:MAG: TetR/AcrR family transcriptional regulator [Actinomycetota bacterium]
MPQISHRDQLLDGAIQCLRTKGYARTTARDIATAANGNLASIGYHFGSKEALLNEAIMRACEEWTTRLGQAAFASGSDSPLEHMGASWVAMLNSFDELRPVLIGLVEAIGQSAWSDDLRRELAAHYKTSREQVASMVRASLGEGAEHTGVDASVVASFLIAVCDGLVLQWLLDPDATPTGEQLISALGGALDRALQNTPVQP